MTAVEELVFFPSVNSLMQSIFFQQSHYLAIPSVFFRILEHVDIILPQDLCTHCSFQLRQGFPLCFQACSSLPLAFRGEAVPSEETAFSRKLSLSLSTPLMHLCLFTALTLVYAGLLFIYLLFYLCARK